jgi:Leucine-rich repeat (LRR) protein
MVKFRGAEISEAEANVLKELEEGQRWKFVHSRGDSTRIYPPEFIAFITHIVELNCHQVKLGKLPKSFGGLRWLRKLWLYECQLTELPESIGELISLEHFDASHNKLKSISDKILQLRNLEDLAIYDNNLDDMPIIRKFLYRNS